MITVDINVVAMLMVPCFVAFVFGWCVGRETGRKSTNVHEIPKGEIWIDGKKVDIEPGKIFFPGNNFPIPMPPTKSMMESLEKRGGANEIPTKPKPDIAPKPQNQYLEYEPHFDYCLLCLARYGSCCKDRKKT